MKFRSLHILPLLSLALIGIGACDDSASSIGSSITDDIADIIVDSAFTVEGKTVEVKSIAPRTTTQLLGAIDVPGYGRFSSDVVTQFLPSTQLDTANFSAEDVDSLYLNLTYARGAFIGDSVAPMGITVYPLTKALPNDINSAFNPEGYYDPTPIATKIYNASTLHESAEVGAATYRTIGVKLPTSRGREIFQAFVDNPANFQNGQVFSENVFPGLYLRSSFGIGRMTSVSVTGLSFFFTKITEDGADKDTTVVEQQYMLVTPEVISNNDLDITLTSSLQQRIDDGQTMLVAPAGTEMEVRFPLPEVLESYRNNGGTQAVLNGLAMTIPADTLESGVGLTAPPYVLLVLKKDRDAFFAQNKLTDNITSFYSEYDETNNCYKFSNLRQYLLDMSKKENLSEEDYTFSLVPVQIDFESSASSSYYYYNTSSVMSDIQPFLVTPTAAHIRFDKAKVKLTLSRLKFE